jgi:peptidylprolyl isomerase
MVDEKVHNFYMYFTIFLFLILILLIGGLYYLEKHPTETIVERFVIIDTNYGEIKIELFLEKSPITAGNFKTLVESGFYDRTKFHRVIDGFMIQGGDPLSRDNTQLLNWGTGGSETIIEDEFIEGLSNKKGFLSMANSGPNTGSSQFFINLQDNTFLDWDKAPTSSKHPVFGKVVEGMEIIELIGKVETTLQPYNRPEEHIIITSAVISAE